MKICGGAAANGLWDEILCVASNHGGLRAKRSLIESISTQLLAKLRENLLLVDFELVALRILE